MRSSLRVRAWVAVAVAATMILVCSCTISRESTTATVARPDGVATPTGPSSGATTSATDTGGSGGEAATPGDGGNDGAAEGDGAAASETGDSKSDAPSDSGSEQGNSTSGGESGESNDGASGSGESNDGASGSGESNDGTGDSGESNDGTSGTASTTGTASTASTTGSGDRPPQTTTSGSFTAGEGAFDEKSPVSTVGIGSVYFGMSPDEAAERAGTTWEGVPAGGADCYVVTPSNGPPGVALWVYHGAVERVDIDTPLLRTRSGLGVGTSLSTLQDRLGDKLDVQNHPRLPGWILATFVPTDPNDAAFRIAFDVSGSEVVRYRTGRAELIALDACE